MLKGKTNKVGKRLDDKSRKIVKTQLKDKNVSSEQNPLITQSTRSRSKWPIATESKQSSDNNATISNAEPVVGSAKSLIDSIKNAKHRKNTSAPDKASDAYYAEPPIAHSSNGQSCNNPIELLPKDVGDGIEVDVDPAQDDFQDEQSEGSLDEGSDRDSYESSSQSSNNSSFTESISEDEDSPRREHRERYRSTFVKKRLQQPTKSPVSRGAHTDPFHSEVDQPPFSEQELSAVRQDPKVQYLLQELRDKEWTDQRRKGTKIQVARNRSKIKSPSDTTIYDPALQCSKQNSPSVCTPVIPVNNSVPDQVNLIDQISSFIDQIHMKSDISATQEAVTSEAMISHASPRQPAASAENRQRDVRDQIVIESEQFKADVNKPTGIHNNFGQINAEDFVQFIKNIKR